MYMNCKTILNFLNIVLFRPMLNNGRPTADNDSDDVLLKKKNIMVYSKVLKSCKQMKKRLFAKEMKTIPLMTSSTLRTSCVALQ